MSEYTGSAHYRKASPSRISNSRRRRQREIRIKLMLAFSMLLIVSTLIIALSSFVVRANNADDSSFKYFTSIEVQPGDSLWSISNTYMDQHYDSNQEYIQEVKRINSLDSEAVQAGQFIIVPYYAEMDYASLDA